MRRLFVTGALLAGMVCGWAHAAVVYSWEATCTQVRIRQPDVPDEILQCTRAHGTIQMLDSYVPGSTLNENLGVDPNNAYPIFSIYTDIGVGFGAISMMEFVNITLPALSGIGTIEWIQNGAGIRDQVFAIESPFPGGTLISMGEMSFELLEVPEPTSLALLGAGMLGLLGLRRRI